MEVADFNEQQVRVFAAHWFREVYGDAGEKQAQEFLGHLFQQKNKAIRELAITPILLSLTCLVFREKGKFYLKRSKLYEEGLELLLVQWDKSREVERDDIYQHLLVERKLELLSYIAVKKFEQEQYVLFEQEELERYIGEFLRIERQESQEVLRAIASQHGLLIERSYKVWSFSHLTFQEYLVAKWHMQHKELQKLTQYVYAPHWHEVLLLFGSMLPPSDLENFFKLLQQCINSLIKNNKQIQSFLMWAKTKADSTLNSQYKPAAIRAFYIYFARLEFSWIKELLHPTREVFAYKIDPNFRQDVVNSYEKYYNSSNNFIFSRSNEIAIDIAFSLLFDDDSALFFAIKEMQVIFELELEPQFQLELQFFMHLLPSKILDWSKDDWKYWLNKMRHLMIKHRNIGQKNNFSKNNKNLFNQYYNANIFLVNCLHLSNCSFAIRQEIEKGLLLPSTAIKNHKINKKHK